MPCHVCKYVVRGDLYNQSGVRVLIIHAFALGIAKNHFIENFVTYGTLCCWNMCSYPFSHPILIGHRYVQLSIHIMLWDCRCIVYHESFQNKLDSCLAILIVI